MFHSKANTGYMLHHVSISRWMRVPDEDTSTNGVYLHTNEYTRMGKSIFENQSQTILDMKNSSSRTVRLLNFVINSCYCGINIRI
jgi:hypothetical protein